MFKIKRIYDAESSDDGKRVLIDRVWPRGISKERANLYEWNKDITPSTELRKWFDHRPERFEEFKARYIYELENSPEKIKAVKSILKLENENTVTLLYGAKDPKINHAIVLLNYLNGIKDASKM